MQTSFTLQFIIIILNKKKLYNKNLYHQSSAYKILRTLKGFPIILLAQRCLVGSHTNSMKTRLYAETRATRERITKPNSSFRMNTAI